MVRTSPLRPCLGPAPLDPHRPGGWAPHHPPLHVGELGPSWGDLLSDPQQESENPWPAAAGTPGSRPASPGPWPGRSPGARPRRGRPVGPPRRRRPPRPARRPPGPGPLTFRLLMGVRGALPSQRRRPGPALPRTLPRGAALRPRGPRPALWRLTSPEDWPITARIPLPGHVTQQGRRWA